MTCVGCTIVLHGFCAASAHCSRSNLQVDRRGYGTAMFASQADAEDAVKLVDGSDMKNMRGSCVVRVDPERGPERDTRRRSRSRCEFVMLVYLHVADTLYS